MAEINAARPTFGSVLDLWRDAAPKAQKPVEKPAAKPSEKPANPPSVLDLWRDAPPQPPRPADTPKIGPNGPSPFVIVGGGDRPVAPPKPEPVEDKAKAQARLLTELKKVGGDKGYTLEQYADGWGMLLNRAEVPEGPLRDLVNEYGRQMFTADYNGTTLSNLMKKVTGVDQAAADDNLAHLNEQLGKQGLVLKVELDKLTGQVGAMEMREVGDGETPLGAVRVTADGRISSSEVTGQSTRNIPLSQALIRLAKRSEPAACP